MLDSRVGDRDWRLHIKVILLILLVSPLAGPGLQGIGLEDSVEVNFG